eukprot:m.78954 g.78954  ORF g.78954 m.78954 type:complete len:194 (+) comp19246_c0_seq2:116-697(+)
MDAAHLLDVAGAAEPSFFELASQRSMALVLGPALKYLVTVLASWRPRELGRLLGRIDEVILVVEYFLQRHYLREHAATLAENFYGLKRVSLSPNDGDLDLGNVDAVPSGLTARQRALSLFFTVMGPYLAKKAEAYHVALTRNRNHDNSAPAPENAPRLVQAFRRVFLKGSAIPRARPLDRVLLFLLLLCCAVL